jgi:hypothetical protein
MTMVRGAVMPDIHDMELRDGGWAVIDHATGLTVTVNGVLKTGLLMDDADDLADLLNHIASARPAQLS